MSNPIVRVSPNGRFFVDQNGKPQFWLGDTQWNLFRSHTFDEAKRIIENRSKIGFTVIQVMLLGFKHKIHAPAVNGEAFPDHDPMMPNQAYFSHVESIIELARQHGIVLVIGLDHPTIRLVNQDTARSYGRWIGERFGKYPNIIWAATYLVPEGENLAIMREIAQGLHEGDTGHHLITCHPDPADPVATSGISHHEEWLDFNCIQTFSSIHLIVDAVAADYARIPAKPVVMAEGAYEAGPEYGFEVTPRLIRKQAYLSYFAGGHHSYGHNDNWRVPPTWEASLKAPGAHHLSVLKEFFTNRRWWEYSPDAALYMESTINNANDQTACSKVLASANRDSVLIYSDRPTTLTFDLEKIPVTSPVTAYWFDPRNGDVLSVADCLSSGLHALSSPAEWEDSLLILETAQS